MVWEVALSPSDHGAELANCQCCSRRTAENDGGVDEDATKQPTKGEDRTEMKKEARRLRCTLLNGSTWSTEKNMRRYKGKCAFFLDRAQFKKGRKGGAVQQRSQGRVEIYS